MTPGDKTRSVHGPTPPERGSLTPPIHQTSTFVLDSAQDVDDVYEGRREGDVYSRYSNPTTRHLEQHLAALEGTEAALVSGSGMAAIATTLLAFVPAGGRVVANADLYGGTANLLKFLHEKHGVRVDTFPTHDAMAMEELILHSKTDLVFVETPTNPTLRLVDLKVAAEVAKRAGAVTAVDSTFGTPINTHPHQLGIDVVIHSATKYLGGHSDVTAGAVCATKENVQKIHGVHKLFGPVLDPHAAFLIERGIRTLALRVKAANENGQAVAEHLARHAAVHAVHYPGLATHPQHALAKRQMPGGYGGLLSFDLATFVQARRFLDELKLVRNAASLGGTESLCSLPFQQSHRNQPRDKLAASGITEGTVRLACGVEDAADIIADVDRALAAVTK